MSPIELPDRRQVQSRRQHPEPCAPPGRMQVDGVMVGNGAKEEMRCQPEEQRFAELDTFEVGWYRDHVRCGHGKKEDGDEHDETGDWAGNADVEELPFGWNRLPDTNHRSERAQRADKRQG